MNPYTFLSSGLDTRDAADLSARLSAWHDAMVAHERRLRRGPAGHACDDECPHAEARALWSEAVATFGERAHDLTFLRSRAQPARRMASTPRLQSEAADYVPRRGPDTHQDAAATPSAASRPALGSPER
jgi:hypothetical protein